MESEVLDLICDPDTRYSFELDENTLRNTATGRVYPIRDGIPLFVSSLKGPDLKYQAMYDRIAPGYDVTERLYRFLSRKPDLRPEMLRELELKPGARVLEVGVGTGINLSYLPASIEFYGVDISWGMLKKCNRNLKRWGRKGRLFQAEASRLPFRAEVFDAVFHITGLNYFTFRERAIKEMIWVTKHGGRVVIVDEIPAVLRAHGDAAGAQAASANSKTALDLIPAEMEDVRVRELGEGKYYCVSFRKPMPAEDAYEI